METITHSLLGAALAELALPAGATKVQRRIFFAAGIVAANRPLDSAGKWRFGLRGGVVGL